MTPYLVDHSAFDTYALLVEAGGKRLLYSGDIRAHGRKPRSLSRLASAAGRVDTLLLEGTRIVGSTVTSEADVETRCAGLFARTPGLALACFSAQNVDRLVTLYRAARRAGRVFDVRVYLARSERRRVIAAGAFDLVERHRHRRVFADQLAATPERFVLSTRASTLPEIRAADLLDGARAVWSLWPGYLKGGKPFGVPLDIVHASGHASATDLAAFAQAVDARQVVPVHTEHPEAYNSLMRSVNMGTDGEWWSA